MKIKWMKLWLLCFLLAYNVGQAQAQEELDPAPTTVSATMETGNITVDFKDADIHDVLKILSYKSGINIVASADVSGTVTLRLVDVPWERALEVILKNSGFVYERDADVIRVTTVENLSKEELSTQLFILNYAQADLVATAIKEMLTGRGRAKVDKRTNQLVVTDVPTNIYKISKVIEKLDAKTQQVLIEAKIIETVLDRDEKLGIDWTLESFLSGASTQTRFPLPMVGAKQLDRPATLEQESGTMTLGTISFADLQLALEILKLRSDTKTLSNPRIVTLNNKEAIIHVGEDYNIPTYERNSSTGQMEITGYEKEKIGIKLTVTPHVNAQGEIVLDLHPEISSILPDTQTFGDIEVPVFSTREATTQVMIKDGETIVIGGLIKDRTMEYVKKVPILGDIPLLKYFFSKTIKEVDTTDLIIFVTVRLLETENSDANQKAQRQE